MEGSSPEVWELLVGLGAYFLVAGLALWIFWPRGG